MNEPHMLPARRRDRLYAAITLTLGVLLLPAAFLRHPGRARELACGWALRLRFPRRRPHRTVTRHPHGAHGRAHRGVLARPSAHRSHLRTPRRRHQAGTAAPPRLVRSERRSHLPLARIVPLGVGLRPQSGPPCGRGARLRGHDAVGLRSRRQRQGAPGRLRHPSLLLHLRMTGGIKVPAGAGPAGAEVGGGIKRCRRPGWGGASARLPGVGGHGGRRSRWLGLCRCGLR